ncbi:MAG TPA: efflux RND transporter periplasmic adaptor subunit [Melioribacteraceae bacterium]|nr:efflux RND transporter periplasmic adaptor subunit [Melioribacteraceae bacterium]
MKLLSKTKFFISVLLTLFVLTACGGNDAEKNKTMAQLQNEEGIPVKVKTVEPTNFNRYISFYSTLAGFKESVQGAMVGDRVEKVLVNVGSYVKENQVVMTFPIDNPSLQYEQAKVAFDNTEKTYLRTKTLYEAGETSQSNFEAIETKYKVDKRNIKAMEQALFVQSPISGKIVEIYIKEGTSVKSETPLFKVAQIDRLRAKFYANEEEVRNLKLGMPAEIEYLGKTYVGRISEIAIAMDQYRKGFSVEALFENAKQELTSGLTVDIKIKTYSKPNTVIIPRNIIQKENGKFFVYVVNGDTADKKYITTGEEEGINTEVLSGLSKGDNLVVEGGSKLEPGKKIKIIK